MAQLADDSLRVARAISTPTHIKALVSTALDLLDQAQAVLEDAATRASLLEEDKLADDLEDIAGNEIHDLIKRIGHMPTLHPTLEGLR